MFISLTSWLSSKWFSFLLFKEEDLSPCLRALEINMRHVGCEIHLRTRTRNHLCLIFLSCCQEEMRPRPALIFIANNFEMVKKRKGSRITSLVYQGSSVSGHWILKPLDRGSNLIDLQRYTVFLILDQPEKTLGSVRLKCKFYPFFNLPLVLRGYKSICWQRTSVHSITGTLSCNETFNAS